MTFTQDAIGLTTNVLLPDNQTVRFEYDATHRLTAVRLNGALLVGNAKKDGTRGNATLAIARERLQRVVESMVRPAHAQVAVPVGAIGLGSVVPGMALPGQPGVTATSILTANDYQVRDPGRAGCRYSARARKRLVGCCKRLQDFANVTRAAASGSRS